MSDARDPQDDLLAAELAFGLLDAPERAVAEARCAQDPAFDALCETWRSHAAGLFGEGDVQPDAAVWAAIQRRLPANDAGEAVALRRSVRTWRATSAMLAIVALAAGGSALLRPPPPPPPVVQRLVVAAAPTVVLLTGEAHAGAMAVSYDRMSGRIVLASSGMAIDRRAAQLWVIPADKKPRSLGVVPANATDTRVPSAEIRALIAAGATLAISVEPAGGSPTGQPTGPVILTGKVATS